MRNVLSVAIAGLLLSACVAPLTTTSPRSGDSVASPLPEGQGRATITIHWPDGVRQVQAIPYDASLARVSVFEASGNLLASASVARASGQVESTIGLDLAPGSGRYVQVELDSPSVTRIATGRSLDFAVRRNQSVTVPVVPEPVIKTLVGPISAFSISGGTTASRGFARIYSVSVAPDGTAYFADLSDHAIRAIAPDGGQRVVVGQVTDTATESQGIAATLVSDAAEEGGLAVQATARIPHGVYASTNGDLFVADTLPANPGVRIRLVPATSGARFGLLREAGHIYTLRKSMGAYAAAGMVQDVDGSLLYTEQAKHEVWRLTQDGSASLYVGNASGSIADGTVPEEASLNAPWGLALDPLGNLAISEWKGGRVRMLCRTAGTYFGVPMEAGRVYTIMDGLAIKAQFALTSTPAPRQLAFDRKGDLFFIDPLSSSVYRISRSDRTVSRIAGGSQTLTNSLLVGDEGVATSASFQVPVGLAIDHRNRLYVGDTNNGRIRWLFL